MQTTTITMMTMIPATHHPHPLGPVDPVPEPQPGNPLPPEPVGPHPTPAPV